MFVVVILHRIDPRRGGPYLRAQRKSYLVDPLLASLPRRLRPSDAAPTVTALVENAVITARFRGEERPLVEEFALPQALFYWKFKSGGEVDALVGRYARRPWRWSPKGRGSASGIETQVTTASKGQTKFCVIVCVHNRRKSPCRWLYPVLSPEGVVAPPTDGHEQLARAERIFAFL